jgi:RHS repeat-associated protein
VLTDVAGHVGLTSTYDPFGNTVGGAPTTSEQTTTQLLFAGQYRDAESNLYYLRARYYDPATAQFMSVDPVVQISQEPYGYVENDPTNGTDPTGLLRTNPFLAPCPTNAVPTREDCIHLINYLNNLLGSGHNPARVDQWQKVYQANKQLLSHCRKLFGLVPNRPQRRPSGQQEGPSAQQLQQQFEESHPVPVLPLPFPIPIPVPAFIP